MLSIKPVRRTARGNRYCGPAAISAIVGCTTDDAARVIRSIGGRSRVRGTSLNDLEGALRAFGAHIAHIHNGNAVINYARLLGVYLIVYRSGPRSCHCAVVGNGKYVCSIYNKPTNVEGETGQIKLRATVVWAIKVTDLNVTTPAALVKVKKVTDPWMRKTRALVKKTGVVVQVEESGTIWVYPTVPFATDKYDDAHYHDTWEEAYRAVFYYSKGGV